MAEQGVETGAFGGWLTEYLQSSPEHRDYTLYFDHGDKLKYANVLATKAFCGDAVSNSNRLADVDVVVVRSDGVADLIIEIEERPCSPKKILGDVLALMLCNHLAARIGGRQTYFEFSNKTTFIVAGIQPGKGQRLTKIKTIIEPRLHGIAAPADSIDPANIQLIFAEQIYDVLAQLREIVVERFPKAKGDMS
ncbi:MAG: hypothetical protein WC405_00355 [Syntrophales bacterium]